MNCNFYRSICKECGNESSVPLQSMFSYGQFIFCGTDGITYRYLDANVSKHWLKIHDIIVNSKLSKLEKMNSDIDHFHCVVASCIDSEGVISFLNHFVCPRCHSRKLSYSDDNNLIVKSEVIENATFSSFEKLTETEKIALVIDIWNKVSIPAD